MRHALLIVPLLALLGCPNKDPAPPTAVAEAPPPAAPQPAASDKLRSAIAAGAVVGEVVKKAPAREKVVMLAGERLEAPPGFGLTLVQQPPLEKLSAVSDGARCDFGILLNHDTPEERAKLMDAMKQQYPGAQKPYAHQARGLKLEGVEVRGGGQDIRVFSAPIGKDLLAVSYAGPFAETDKCDPLLGRLLDVLGKAK